MFALRGLKVAKSLNARFASSLVTKFETSVQKLPLKEAVRYTKHDLKWTAKEFNDYIDSHANALLEFNIKKGDTIAIWMHDCAEKHVAMMAAAKAGIKIVDVDQQITDVNDVRAFLTASDCKMIYFRPEYKEYDYLHILRQAIPEFFSYDDSHGQMFHSKYFRKLRYFVQTGPDIENGCLNYKGLFLPHPTEDMLSQAAASNTDNDPIYQQIKKGGKGIEVGEALTATKVLDLPAWGFAKKVIDQQYFEL